MGQTCPICYSDLLECNSAALNTCFHSFCFRCIDQWTEKQKEHPTPEQNYLCPLCKQPYTFIIHGYLDKDAFRCKYVEERFQPQSGPLGMTLNLTETQIQRRRLYTENKRIDYFSLILMLGGAVWIDFDHIIETGKKDENINKNTKSEIENSITTCNKQPKRSFGHFLRKATSDSLVKNWVYRELQLLVLKEDVTIFTHHVLGVLARFQSDAENQAHTLGVREGIKTSFARPTSSNLSTPSPSTSHSSLLSSPSPHVSVSPSSSNKEFFLTKGKQSVATRRDLKNCCASTSKVKLYSKNKNSQKTKVDDTPKNSFTPDFKGLENSTHDFLKQEYAQMFWKNLVAFCLVHVSIATFDKAQGISFPNSCAVKSDHTNNESFSEEDEDEIKQNSEGDKERDSCLGSIQQSRKRKERDEGCNSTIGTTKRKELSLYKAQNEKYCYERDGNDRFYDDIEDQEYVESDWIPY